MVLTLPWSTGVVAALIFLLFELLVIPVLMFATSFLASFFTFRRAAKGSTIQVRSATYPLWSEGLFHRQPSHALLFLLRIVCIVVPVYLETRFISNSNPVLVSKLVQEAFVPDPKEEDEDLTTDYENYFDSISIPTEVFSRCTVSDDDGWVHAKVANVTAPEMDRLAVQCVSGTDKVLYRSVERVPPFVEPSIVQTESFNDTTPSYRRNITLEVLRVEGPFREFPPSPGLKDDGKDEEYLQLKNVNVLGTKDIECFFWRSPLPGSGPPINDIKLGSFFCQNVTGGLVDYYYASIEGMTNESNARILGRDGNLVSKQFTVSTTLNFLGSLEFHDKIVINAGHIVRKHSVLPPYTLDSFTPIIRRILYSRASNVTVEIPGNERTNSVELDGVVVVVGAAEVLLVLSLGSVVALLSKYRWKIVQRTNTVEGLSYIWAQSRALSDDCLKVLTTLRLRKCVHAGEERFMYEAIGMESLH